MQSDPILSARPNLFENVREGIHYGGLLVYNISMVEEKAVNIWSKCDQYYDRSRGKACHIRGCGPPLDPLDKSHSSMRQVYCSSLGRNAKLLACLLAAFVCILSIAILSLGRLVAFSFFFPSFFPSSFW